MVDVTLKQKNKIKPLFGDINKMKINTIQEDDEVFDLIMSDRLTRKTIEAPDFNARFLGTNEELELDEIEDEEE